MAKPELPWKVVTEPDFPRQYHIDYKDTGITLTVSSKVAAERVCATLNSLNVKVLGV